MTLEAAASLELLEHWLVAVSTELDGAARGVERASALYGTGTPAELENVVTPGPRLSALERLGIYNDGYFARLVECLRDDYPAVLVGKAQGTLTTGRHLAFPKRTPMSNLYVEMLDRMGVKVDAFGESRTSKHAAFDGRLPGLA